MRRPINLREAPSRVQRVISLRMSGMKDTSWVGTKSRAPVVPHPRAGLRRSAYVSATQQWGAGGGSETGSAGLDDRRMADHTRTVFFNAAPDANMTT